MGRITFDISTTDNLVRYISINIWDKTEVNQTSNNAPIGKHWIKDLNEGVYVWNPEPKEGESVRWNGRYIQDGNYRYADGYGTLLWFKGDKLIQTDEGTFERGRHHGEFAHIFPSGKVIHSNWNHGQEISK